MFMCGEKCKQMNTNKSSLHSSIRFSTFLTASNTEKPLWKARSWRNSIYPASTKGRFCKQLQSPLVIRSLTPLSFRSRVRPAIPLQLLPLKYQRHLRAEQSLSRVSPITYVTLISHQISTAPTGIKPEALQMLWHCYRETAISRILHKIWVNRSWCDEYFLCYFKAVQQSPTPALGTLGDGLNREKMPPGRNDILAYIPTTFQTLSGFGHLFPKHLQNLQRESNSIKCITAFTIGYIIQRIGLAFNHSILCVSKSQC